MSARAAMAERFVHVVLSVAEARQAAELASAAGVDDLALQFLAAIDDGPLLRFAEVWPADATEVEVAPSGEDRWAILVHGDTLAVCGDENLARKTAAHVRDTLRQETSARSRGGVDILDVIARPGALPGPSGTAAS